MATTRGFVERIEVGRAGLVRVTLVNEGGPTVFTVSDIDGDPERFNERLTKVAVLRDAMNRAEPVEIESAGGDGDGAGAAEVQRVARISRDELSTPGTVDLVGGLILRVVVQSRNVVQGEGELHDDARVSLLDTAGELRVLRLDLQAPERLVAAEQLRLIRDAHASGSLVQFLVVSDTGDSGDARSEPDILSVWAGDDVATGRDKGSLTVSGFVESLGVILPPGVGPVGGALALTRLTTAPEFTGEGGTVDPALFVPQDLALFVARGSVPYALVEAGLRDNVRMRVRYRAIVQGGEQGVGHVAFRSASDARAMTGRYASTLEVGTHDGAGSGADGADGAGGAGGAGDRTVTALLLSAELLAPLASASRPVWVHIDRETLDRGPAADCVPGLPSSSLHPRGLRDLRIPYPAEWVGHACFNAGIFRFQLTAPEGSTIEVDGEEICLYAADAEGVAMTGYACLDGDHVVTVEIPEYVCDTEFDLDVYRIR